MQTLRYIAGAVLLALLAVIAYDLHRIAYAIGPRGNIETVMMLPYIRGAETREQRIERNARDIDQGSDEWIATMKRAAEMHRAEAKRSSTPSR